MHLTGLYMHVLHALPHDVTGWCVQLLHGLCCLIFLRHTFISSYFEDQSYLCFILEVIDCPVSHIFVSKFCQCKYYLTEQWDFWGRILSHLWSTDKRCEWDWNVLFGIVSHLGKWDGDELGETSYWVQVQLIILLKCLLASRDRLETSWKQLRHQTENLASALNEWHCQWLSWCFIHNSYQCANKRMCWILIRLSVTI
jgi:hypothetical protein